MAKVESLGIHTPVALPYLIREGLLAPDPREDSYRWETYICNDGDVILDEELLTTQDCVVWSQGCYIRSVYRFGLEGEDVRQAILTSFPSVTQEVHPPSETTSQTHWQPIGREQGVRPLSNDETRNGEKTGSSRALVVVLKTKLHVYFLSGAQHIIDLPFEVERAFPAPHGCILQRKSAALMEPPHTPQVPAVPPNSFLFSRSQTSASYLQSPTLQRSLGGSVAVKANPPGTAGGLDALLKEVFGRPAEGIDLNSALLYTMSDPLSDMAVVTCSFQHRKARVSGGHEYRSAVDFEYLDAAEELIYVSANSEVATSSPPGSGELMLLVTFNTVLQIVNVWHAYYLDEKSLKTLMKQRATSKAAQARRRNSFMSTAAGTGTTTPAVRTRDHNARESFAAAGSIRMPGDPHTSHSTATAPRPGLRSNDEEAMVKQMDPEFQLPASQQVLREGRRISSLNADMRTSQTAAVNSFASGRRNASFGGAGDRRSLGIRKSRGSTPGSVFARSLGRDDDEMDLDSDDNAGREGTVEVILRHMRATFEAAGADSLFGDLDQNGRRDLVVRKVHSYRVDRETAASGLKVVVLRDTRLDLNEQQTKVNVYILDRMTKEVRRLVLQVTKRQLWPELHRTTQVAVPVLLSDCISGQASDIVKISCPTTEAVLLGERGLVLSNSDNVVCTMPQRAAYRVYPKYDATAVPRNEDYGSNRTVDVPNAGLSFGHSSAEGQYDEIDLSGTHHRRRLILQTEDPLIHRLLGALELVLPTQQASLVRSVWCMAYSWLDQRPECLAATACGIEWTALATTTLFFAVPLLDEKAQAALKLARLASGKQRARESSGLQLRKLEHERRLFQRKAWEWVSESSSLQNTVSDSVTFDQKKDLLLPVSAALAMELSQTIPKGTEYASRDGAIATAIKMTLALHVVREELKLSTLSTQQSSSSRLGPLIAQIGGWLNLPAWSADADTYYGNVIETGEHWAFVKSTLSVKPQMPLMDRPIGVYEWFEHAIKQRSSEPYSSLAFVAGLNSHGTVSRSLISAAEHLTPRLCALSDIVVRLAGLTAGDVSIVELLSKRGVDQYFMDTLPSAIAAPFKEAIARCEREPPTSWPGALLELVGREDLLTANNGPANGHGTALPDKLLLSRGLRDMQAVCHALEYSTHSAKTREATRHDVSQLIFHRDRRLVEATNLMHYNSTQEAECAKQPDWSDAHHFERQRRVIEYVTVRMWALPAGDGMIHYDCISPLLTEKYMPYGFGSRCVMQPMGITLNIDRTAMSEEKVGWAYFHAGVSSGLRMSKKVKGIDTSWIAFNKPTELTNRHAGLLLALGLGGHLRSLAKWLSFKYLTPKHTMTSVGLLLGLSASQLGTMDGLITRMLSVHITRMLPPGAAELNVSPITQTAGLMGIGLLYYNSQHRRMSEMMLSEIEYMELEDPDSGPDPLRNESYRLAAGFALGLINLGKGKELRGLHGLHLPERLLSVAIGPRPVQAVHVFDRATAGAIIAVALVYMKTGDNAMAHKIDIPDTEAQYDHVRPDMLMLRVMARHIIMWDKIQVPESDKLNRAEAIDDGWIESNLPSGYKGKLAKIRKTDGMSPFTTADVPFLNIATGLAWAISLRYAGSGYEAARNEILALLRIFNRVGGQAYYYDAHLARTTVDRCVDVLALAAATVMAGTGDVDTFRYLRRLHGRTDAETTYGSHLAAHLAIGVLFLGGGTYTLGTSDLATAALICAFYPLFPADVHDNRVHLQAFRHFWVFAAEARCLVFEDVDTQRPISMRVKVCLRNKPATMRMTPCLLPPLDTITKVETENPSYWKVTLDFAGNREHLASFRRNQTISVRRCPVSEAHSSVFTASFRALNDAKLPQAMNDLWLSIFSVPSLREVDRADIELILPPDAQSFINTSDRGTVVDERLEMQRAVESNDRDKLWNLRVLFAWAERVSEQRDGSMRWIGREVVERLKAAIDDRSRRLGFEGS
ncbi:hypothetical protein BAUCODRAFT_367184 [Baudoinia panamericana UAMH 10762]|uniref:Uncharacterized protein n=1 Tax=Baudoinia panamericana (strain UAMH 10762) TaxID=717646 RepID=M2N7U1_BAUPA|nr:uncharacterized protein BAUCODRAFT_367184 [Baudoinia panamericana UAMH 10762]EMD00169.1 hypothetical protein BAUCODRAFT_367184 [Baudoinia panamericana UAMH 10762]